MNKTNLIKIISSILLIIVVIFGIFWLIKNRDAVGIIFKNISTVGETREEASPKQKILDQIKEKEAQYNKLNKQIISAQSSCVDVDLENLTKKRIEDINRENFTQVVGGYYTCEAIKNKNIDRCDFLKDINGDLFKSCVLTTASIDVTREKCSARSIDQCVASGFLKQPECNDMCSVYSKNDATACDVIKNNADLYAGCLALARKNVSLCNNISDEFQRTACVDEYYLYSSIRDNNADLLNKIIDSFKKSLAKAVFDENLSCGEEFSQHVHQDDCMSGLVDDYENIQNTAGKLKFEIDELNRQLQEL